WRVPLTRGNSPRSPCIASRVAKGRRKSLLLSQCRSEKTSRGRLLRHLTSLNHQPRARLGEVLSLLDNETGMHSCLESKPRSPGDTGGKRRHPRAYENTGIGADEPEA